MCIWKLFIFICDKYGDEIALEIFVQIFLFFKSEKSQEIFVQIIDITFCFRIECACFAIDFQNAITEASHFQIQIRQTQTLTKHSQIIVPNFYPNLGKDEERRHE